tara:strand:+ start:146826 stop:147356 length:531 start_codon:yes stop_codon:yes gene_type:complete
MRADKDFNIKFTGLKLGTHEFDFELDKSFFDHFEFSDFEDANLKLKLLLEKKNNSLELDFKLSGTVLVPCDISNELFDLALENEISLLVKFGEEFNDENEEILILPFDSHYVDISQIAYELAVLTVPLKKIHPDVLSGKKGGDILQKMESLSPEIQSEAKEDEIDPRWDKLKNLLN